MSSFTQANRPRSETNYFVKIVLASLILRINNNRKVSFIKSGRISLIILVFWKYNEDLYHGLLVIDNVLLQLHLWAYTLIYRIKLFLWASAVSYLCKNWELNGIICMSITFVCVRTCMCVYIHIYIYVYGEREISASFHSLYHQNKVMVSFLSKQHGKLS